MPDYDDFFVTVEHFTPTLRMLATEFSHLPQLRRVAYVCEGGEVKYTHDTGFSSLTAAFIARPRSCQYCVFDLAEGGAILINMYELQTTAEFGQILTVKPGTDVRFVSADAAIMYALTIE